MRLWHYKLIPFLPDAQLKGQWSELNWIFKNQPNHILINYVYEYDELELDTYAFVVIAEMFKRKIKIHSWSNFYKYFYSGVPETDVSIRIYSSIRTIDYTLLNIRKNQLFKNHHTDRYLLQCFYNLQEKYDRGQKDFSEEQYKKLEEFVNKEIGL